MADKNKQIKPTKLSSSTSFSIGGKKYSSEDIVHAHNTNTTPRQVGKAFENQLGVVHTSKDTFPSQSVHTQTESYKPSGNTQATVQTSRTPDIKSSVSIPLASMPKIGSDGGSIIGMSPDKISEIKMNYARMGITNNVTTSSFIESSNTAKIFTMTSGMAQLNAASRVMRSSPSFNYQELSTGDFVRSLGRVASYTIATEAVDSLRSWKEKAKSNDFLTGGKLILGKTESGLLSNDDLGTQSTGGMIAAGMMGYSGFRTAQKTSEVGIKGIKNISNGVYQISTTVGTASVTVGRTAKTLIDRQIVPISKDAINVLKAQAVASGLNNTQMIKGIVNKVNAVQSAYSNAVSNLRHIQSTVATGIKTIHHSFDTSVNIVHGLATGRMTVNAAKERLNAFKNRAFSGLKVGLKKGVRTTLGYTVHGAVKGVSVAAFRGVPATGKLLKGSLLTGAGAMMGTDDYAVRGVGNAITTADIGIKTGVHAGKAMGYTVKTAVKGGKNVYQGAKFIKNNGLRSAWDAVRNKTAKKIAQAGKSITTGVVNLVKAVGTKIVIPLVLIAVIVVAVFGAISAPVMTTATIFGGVFETETGEKDIREYLEANVPKLSLTYRQKLADRMAESWNTHHIVRFYYNSGSGDVIEPTFAGITSVFPTDEELCNMLHPIFNALVLMNYDLSPTDEEAAKLLEELFNGLFRVTTVETVEQCGQDLKTGKGEVIVHSCGSVHALEDCPNPLIGKHSSYTCEDCCYYYCNGHRTANGIYYCKGCIFACSGYKNCGTHKVISYTLSLDGAYALETKYFTDPIDELSNKNPRTEEEEEQLQKLKDYYEIYLEMMNQIGAEYGGGLSMDDMSGVQFINGTRVPNQSVIDLALTQVGQRGGKPYWSYYGFSSRVEWCACFVHWCMNKTPSAAGKYPNTSNNAYCQTVANNFMKMGQWADKDFTNLVAGDTIFFDWGGDGHTDHIGLVIGQDGEYVYTVEGNSGDAVKMKQYRIGSSVIYGYGLMNY